MVNRKERKREREKKIHKYTTEGERERESERKREKVCVFVCVYESVSSVKAKEGSRCMFSQAGVVLASHVKKKI